MELILKFSITKQNDGSYVVEREKLDFLVQVLSHFVENQEENQVQCLRVIQYYINKLEHPYGCLTDILTCLYENVALSKTAFFKWHDDDSPQEQEGKGKIQYNVTFDRIDYIFILFWSRRNIKEHSRIHTVFEE